MIRLPLSESYLSYVHVVLLGQCIALIFVQCLVVVAYIVCLYNVLMNM